MNSMRKTLIASALAVAASAAQAASVTPVLMTEGTTGGSTYWDFNNTALTGRDAETDLQARVLCPTGSCTLLGFGDYENSGAGSEIAALNDLLLSPVAGDGFSQQLSGSWDGDGGTYETSSRYVMFKFGDAVDAWFENVSGGSVTFTFVTGNPYTGGGLSHVTSELPPPEVPLPGTLGLLGLGLAGLGAMRRKKQGA